MAKILIVDDEPRIRDLIREHLQYAGFTCEEAGDGTAALSVLSQGGIDLVILDIMMPFVDGMTCQNCQRRVENALNAMPGTWAAADLAAQQVSILTKDGLRFNSEQLTWDQNKHELSSNVFSKLVTPERTLQGSHFWSDEKMTRYYVSNSKGSFEKGDLTGGGGAADTLSSQPDSVKNNFRQPATPVRATTIPILH